jgi:glycosyltransferase involved in cell wall biosynthesis
MKILKFSKLQIQIALDMIRHHNKSDMFMFFMAEGLFFPVIVAKLLNKRSVLCLAASMPEMAIHASKDTLFLKIFKNIEYISYLFSDRIIVYSPGLISQWNLEPYRHKILIAHRHFLDFNTFTVTTPLPDRPPLIGYIGRLSGEKGVQHFAQALPAILSDRQDLRVLIGGDGPLKELIEASLQERGVTTRVDLPGWISHDDLPRYLNQLRLLVLPSYTEGLPNIMLEAMACGTPVLATPVGAIPDVIIDGKTGFIMENNSPECIAENVKRALIRRTWSGSRRPGGGLWRRILRLSAWLNGGRKCLQVHDSDSLRNLHENAQEDPFTFLFNRRYNPPNGHRCFRVHQRVCQSLLLLENG